MANLTVEEAAGMQMQKEESLRQKKENGVVSPFGGISPREIGRVSPRTHRVNLGLTSDEMDKVKGWVEYVRKLSRRLEDPESDPNYWACSKYPSELNISNFTKLRDQYRIPK
ncbi:hypothetical protein Fot_03676 [Forsythia ovata]|uniref:Uncharacterized protein n=1 Tax=Forsythia ovata TaxID=205694 RepID=A0ABD1XAG3_9LAMI